MPNNTRRNLVLIGIAVAIAVGAWFILRPSHAPKSADEAQPAAAQDPVLQRREARRTSAVDVSAGLLKGRVSNTTTGAPIAGATVSVTERNLDGSAFGYAGSGVGPRTTTTDGNGQWSMRAPPRRYSVSAHAPNFYPGSLKLVVVSAGATQAGVDLALKPGAYVLSGMVTDIGGGPVGGALVSVKPKVKGITGILDAPFATLTQPDGRYAISLGSGRYDVVVSHRDYAAKRKQTEIDAGPRSLDIELVPGGIIEGRVVAKGTGSPVANAMVGRSLSSQFHVSGFMRGGAVTDSDGRFVMRGLKPGVIELRATARGFTSGSPATVELGIAEHVTGVVIPVDTAYTISGFVVASSDRAKAISGAFVGAYNISPGAALLSTHPSAADGYFEIIGVPPGDYTVGAVGEHRLPQFFGDNVTVEDKDLDHVVIELADGLTIAGRVEPAAIAEVRLEVDAEKLSFNDLPTIGASALAHTQTKDGQFTLRGVMPGSYDLVATTEDGREGSVKLDVSDNQDGVVVTLESRAFIAGRVVDQRGRPVVDVRVDATSRTKKRESFSFSRRFGPPSSITKPDGRFRIVGLKNATYDVSVRNPDARIAPPLKWADSDKPTDPRAVVIADGKAVEGLRLVVEQRNETLSGRVVLPDGTPAADSWVTASLQDDDTRNNGDEDHSGDDNQENGRWTTAKKTVLTGSDGSFRINGLRKGHYTLSAVGVRGTARGTVARVATGSHTTIRLHALATVTGVVTGSDGAPVQSFVVRLVGDRTHTRRVTSQQGKYTVDRISRGTYTLSVTADAGTTSEQITLTAGKTTTANLTLKTFGAITGTVVHADGTPAAGLTVMAYSDKIDMSRVGLELASGKGPTTDAEGKFRVGGLPGGSVMLIVFGESGFQPAHTQNATVKAGETSALGTIKLSATADTADDEAGGQSSEGSDSNGADDDTP